MNQLWLEDFLVLAATGNFSRAAAARHLTQPAFSRRIRGLEEWLGAELFDRSTQPAQLTEVGAWFQGIAQELVARVARLPGEAQGVAEASSATLRLAATHVLSFTFLPRWLRGLEAQLTLGPVQLVSDVLPRCEALLLQSKVQFVLSHAHLQAPGLLDAEAGRSVQVGRDELIPVSLPDAGGQPRFPLASRGRRGGTMPALQYTAESGLGRILRAVLGRRLGAVSVQPAFTAHLASVLRTMALDGRGLAWLPESLIEEDLQAGRLVEAAGKDWRVALQIRLYRGPQPLGRAAEDLWKAAGGGR